MSLSSAVTRRDFAKVAMAGAGAAVLGGSVGFLSPEKELVLSLSGTGRMLDGPGKVLQSRALTPGVVTGTVGDDLIRTRASIAGVGTLHAPAPRILAFTRDPSATPQVLRRTDRAEDGTVIETISETVGSGVPLTRTVRVPERQIELTDRYEYRQAGMLSVFERRTISVRSAGTIVADLTILASGEIRLGRVGSLGELVAGSPFLPSLLHAQSCGRAAMHYLGATLRVIAAVLACGVPLVCFIAIIAALIDWALAIDEIENCQT